MAEVKGHTHTGTLKLILVDFADEKTEGSVKLLDITGNIKSDTDTQRWPKHDVLSYEVNNLVTTQVLDIKNNLTGGIKALISVSRTTKI